MAEIIISHCRLGVVTRQGTINVLYPETTGNDVYINSNDTVTSTTLQGMVDNFKTTVDGLITAKLPTTAIAAVNPSTTPTTEGSIWIVTT